MLPNRRGSIFLITLTLLTVVFILGFAFTFFTGEEDYASSMSYESEVAFNLAESAVEEFVARLKNSLNHNDSDNQLYKVLRAKVDPGKEIKLDARQVANLTAYTRDMARQLYGIQFGQGLLESDDFVVDAALKLNYMPHLESKDGDKVLYSYKDDVMEKQGELNVSAKVNFKGHQAKVSLSFMIRCVKTFVPPFNYFTLFVRDASVSGGSDFNTFPSTPNGQKNGLRLDNGWKVLNPDFDATHERYINKWEKELAGYDKETVVPPGRVFLGQDLSTFYTSGGASGVFIRSTNGAKLLYGNNLDANRNAPYQINGHENAFLNLDIMPWMGMKKYVKRYQESQGQEQTKDGLEILGWNITTGWGNRTSIRIFNIGAGKELIEGGEITGGAPSFINCFKSYASHTTALLSKASTDDEENMLKRFLPDLSFSGFHPFGMAPKIGNAAPMGKADFTKLSPTLIYGPATRQYFRAVQIQTESGKEIELPYVPSEAFYGATETAALMLKYPGVKRSDGQPAKLDDVLTASQAQFLFTCCDVPPEHVEKIISNWDDIPEGLREYGKYKNFMSDSGSDLYNKGLGYMLQRLRYTDEDDLKKKYEGPLKEYFEGYLETGHNYLYNNGRWPSTDFGRRMVANPASGYYDGPLSYAMPAPMNTYMYDFYFIPRSTEDFFRGRTTVAIGGVSYDRFVYKYIDDPQAYNSGANDKTLELNGVLSLNDGELLELRRLKFRGHGIIYSSPMMGGGKVFIQGDLIGHDTDLAKFDSSIGNNLLTIVAPQIIISTDAAADDRCYVEANLISTSEPLKIIGSKPITIKGSVATPYLNLSEHLPSPSVTTVDGGSENVIIYNALNGIGLNRPQYLDSLYIAKIVTGGVGKFDWKYER